MRINDYSSIKGSFVFSSEHGTHTLTVTSVKRVVLQNLSGASFVSSFNDDADSTRYVHLANTQFFGTSKGLSPLDYHENPSARMTGGDAEEVQEISHQLIAELNRVITCLRPKTGCTTLEHLKKTLNTELTREHELAIAVLATVHSDEAHQYAVDAYLAHPNVDPLAIQVRGRAILPPAVLPVETAIAATA